MYEEFLTPETTEARIPGAYYISGYGRFGYFVNILLGLFFIPFLFVINTPNISLGGRLICFLLGLGGLGLLFYSCSQFFRKSPRFILDDDGFMYRGMFLRTYVLWTNVAWLRIGGGSRNGFVFLNVHLHSTPRRRKWIRLDVSGMVPNYYSLCEEMKKHISPEAKRNGWI
jgi:hypothetical protein